MDESKMINFFEENGFTVEKESIHLSFKKKAWNNLYPNVKLQEAIFEATYPDYKKCRYFCLRTSFGAKPLAKIDFSIRESRKDEEMKLMLRYFDLMLAISNVYYIIFSCRNYFYANRKKKHKIDYSEDNNLNVFIDENNIDDASFEHMSKTYKFNDLYEFYKEYVPGYFTE